MRSAIALFKKRTGDQLAIWEDVAEKLSRSTRSRVEVNVSEIGRNAKDGETVVVPGVVLSAGNISKKVNVAAWRFSGSAKEKIHDAGGKTLTIEQLRKENPKGTNVRGVAANKISAGWNPLPSSPSARGRCSFSSPPRAEQGEDGRGLLQTGFVLARTPARPPPR